MSQNYNYQYQQPEEKGSFSKGLSTVIKGGLSAGMVYSGAKAHKIIKQHGKDLKSRGKTDDLIKKDVKEIEGLRGRLKELEKSKGGKYLKEKKWMRGAKWAPAAIIGMGALGAYSTLKDLGGQRKTAEEFGVGKKYVRPAVDTVKPGMQEPAETKRDKAQLAATLAGGIGAFGLADNVLATRAIKNNSNYKKNRRITESNEKVLDRLKTKMQTGGALNKEDLKIQRQAASRATKANEVLGRYKKMLESRKRGAIISGGIALAGLGTAALLGRSKNKQENMYNG